MDATTHLRALTRSQGTLIRRLLREKNVRSQEGAFVVEGTKSCLNLIARHATSIRSLVLSPRYLRAETDADRQVRPGAASLRSPADAPAIVAVVPAYPAAG